MAENLTAPPGSVFICYRRDDAGDVTGRIYDWLSRELPDGVVFRDVDSIPFGVDFSQHIRESLTGCRVVLVMIGRQWAVMRDGSGVRRLDDPGDYVRIEAETALSRPGVRVIPVLVGGATLPTDDELPESLRPLRARNGLDVRRDPDFMHDMGRLSTQIKAILNESARTMPPGPSVAATVSNARPDSKSHGSGGLKDPARPSDSRAGGYSRSTKGWPLIAATAGGALVAGLLIFAVLHKGEATKTGASAPASDTGIATPTSNDPAGGQPGVATYSAGIPVQASALPVQVTTDKSSYRNGEPVVCSVKIPYDGYLRVYSIDATGSRTLIFPNGFEKNDQVHAGQTVKVPGTDEYDLKLALPPGVSSGTEAVLAVLSKAPFAQDTTGDYSQGPFQALGPGSTTELHTRGLTPTQKASSGQITYQVTQ